MIYAGETIRVYADISGWDDTPLVPAEVDSATVIISDSSGNVLVEAGSMEWNQDENRWLYRWDSPPVAGTYNVEVVFSTPEGTSVDVRKVRLDSPRSEKKRRGAGPFIERV